MDDKKLKAGFYEQVINEHFAKQLEQAGCAYSKGSIRIPYYGELPLSLIKDIASWCRDTGNHA